VIIACWVQSRARPDGRRGSRVLALKLLLRQWFPPLRRCRQGSARTRRFSLRGRKRQHIGEPSLPRNLVHPSDGHVVAKQDRDRASTFSLPRQPPKRARGSPCPLELGARQNVHFRQPLPPSSR
jgi:hypothetical protein